MITADQQAAVEAVAKYGSRRAAREALGISKTAMHERLSRAEKWLEAPQGQRESIEASRLDTVTAEGGWIITDKDGEIIRRSTRWKAPKTDEDGKSAIDAMREAFEDIPKAPPVAAPVNVEKGKIAFFPHGDWHFGSYVTADQAGVDYNREIALDRLKNGFARCMAAIPPCETAIILNNGDFHHADVDNRDATPRHGHRLKVEGTSHENLRLSTHATIWLIDMALQKHGEVIYRANPGNHDENVPSSLLLALSIRYANEPRVTIEDTESHTWIFQRGKLFIATNHGHGQPPAKFAPNLPTRYPDQFGKSRRWYYFSSHYHNREDVTINGIRCIRLPAVCAIDGHGAQLGFSDTAGMTAMMFSENGVMDDSHDISFAV